MANHEIKLDLLKVPGAKYVKIEGYGKCIILPVENNNLIYVGKKGIYITMSAIERKTPMDGQTHFIKPSYSSEDYKAMTEEQRNAIPIIGSLKPMDKSAPAKEEVQAVTLSANVEQESDFPF